MDKVNEFEYAADEYLNTDVITQQTLFTKNQREPFRYSSAEDLLENLGDLKRILSDFLENHVPRLEILESYDDGSNFGITQSVRRKFKDRPDNRARHNFGGYIATMQNAYLFGIPVRVEHDNSEISKYLVEYDEINDTESLNSALGYDCSRFGRAYELHYRNEEDEDKTALSSVFETFLIYDTTVEQNVIAGVRCPRFTKNGQTTMIVTLYTNDKIITFKACSPEEIKLTIEDEDNHLYNGIPIIEWKNNRQTIGDYEKVLPLIDLYDAAQSDTANYMQEMNDALLLLSGDIDSDMYSKEDMTSMLKAGMMILSGAKDINDKSGAVDGKYLHKQYDVLGKEAYNKRLESDIHKFTHTPDLSDDQFAGTQSGVAIKYKLFGLEQTRSVKERFYTKALRRRYQLISNLHKEIGEIDLAHRELDIIFTENLPNNIWDEIKSFYEVGGELPLPTLIDQLSFVKSTHEQLEMMHTKEFDLDEPRDETNQENNFR